MAYVDPIEPQIEEVVTSIRTLQRGRSRPLAAVTLGVPASLGAERVAAAVRELLATAGDVAIEVWTRPSPGPLQLLTVEFAPDPAGGPLPGPR
jgi:hypothetical protein